MYEAGLHDKAAPVCEGPIGTGADRGKMHPRRKTVQVRFVAACPKGHIQDFPWWEWVFKSPDPQRLGSLRMLASGSASLTGVKLVCEADGGQTVIQSRTLAGAFTGELGGETALSRISVFCQGVNPALAIPSSTIPAQDCGQHLYTVLRGSSNVYFPHIVSSIFLPPADKLSKEGVLEILENHLLWTFLQMTAGATGGSVVTEMAQAALDRFYPGTQVRAEELAAAANRRISGSVAADEDVLTDNDEQKFRRQEYKLLCRDIQEGYPKTNLLVETQSIGDYSEAVATPLECVSLVHKLRETRVFTGFSRIFPDDDLTAAQRRALISREQKDWLPAVIVRGEGIFLKLREDRVQEWLTSQGFKLTSRIQRMQDTLNSFRDNRRQPPRIVSPRFVLVHTLAHILVNQLVLTCGYGSASLRERLYCSDDESHPMSGVLIYTAAGDTEGTMGGLVRMGRAGRLETVVQAALDQAKWCSTDPVCIESHGQGPDNCNLAACYACALLPETSCEEQNRLLDRGLITGTLSDPTLGYFSEQA